MSAQIIRLPCTHKMIERATSQSEKLRTIEKIDWNARAAFDQLKKGNVAAARRFIRHILATTTGAT